MLVLSEHADGHVATATHEGLDGAEIRFGQGRNEGICVSVRQNGTNWHLSTGYYVGAGWLLPGAVAVRVQPKLNTERRSLDHMAMLFASLKNPDVAPYVGELYELDLDAPLVALPRQDDLLTPLLVTHFLY